MQEKGVMDQILEKNAPAPQICPALTGVALGFESCFTAFLVLISGAVLGIILLILELCAKTSGQYSDQLTIPKKVNLPSDKEEYSYACQERHRSCRALINENEAT